MSPEYAPDVSCVMCKAGAWITGDTLEKRARAAAEWAICDDCADDLPTLPILSHFETAEAMKATAWLLGGALVALLLIVAAAVWMGVAT